MSLNGKVSHRKLGLVTADLEQTVNQHAHVINNQGEKLKAYGERLADALTRLDKLEAAQRQAGGLETA
jgi:hypothetical protein